MDGVHPLTTSRIDFHFLEYINVKGAILNKLMTLPMDEGARVMNNVNG
jgi:hypothetical protein